MRIDAADAQLLNRLREQLRQAFFKDGLIRELFWRVSYTLTHPERPWRIDVKAVFPTQEQLYEKDIAYIELETEFYQNHKEVFWDFEFTAADRYQDRDNMLWNLKSSRYSNTTDSIESSG